MKKLIYSIVLILFILSGLFGQNEIKHNRNSGSKNEQNEKAIYLSGIIKDSLNEPFYGVNVIIKSTRIGTIANKNGKYEIDITKFYQEKNKIIVIYSFVGFKRIEKEIDFSKNNDEINRTINISLKEKADAINCNG